MVLALMMGVWLMPSPRFMSKYVLHTVTPSLSFTFSQISSREKHEVETYLYSAADWAKRLFTWSSVSKLLVVCGEGELLCVWKRR